MPESAMIYPVWRFILRMCLLSDERADRGNAQLFPVLKKCQNTEERKPEPLILKGYIMGCFQECHFGYFSPKVTAHGAVNALLLNIKLSRYASRQGYFKKFYVVQL